jgi:hypothetical protein
VTARSTNHTGLENMRISDSSVLVKSNKAGGPKANRGQDDRGVGENHATHFVFPSFVRRSTMIRCSGHRRQAVHRLAQITTPIATATSSGWSAHRSSSVADRASDPVGLVHVAASGWAGPPAFVRRSG